MIIRKKKYNELLDKIKELTKSYKNERTLRIAKSNSISTENKNFFTYCLSIINSDGEINIKNNKLKSFLLYNCENLKWPMPPGRVAYNRKEIIELYALTKTVKLLDDYLETNNLTIRKK